MPCEAGGGTQHTVINRDESRAPPRSRHRSHAPRTSRYLSQPFSGHGHGARARRLARLPEPVRGFVSAQWISNERTRFALVVCCVACSAIAIASCAMHGGVPIEYAWQVTTSRVNVLGAHQRRPRSSCTTPSCSSTPTACQPANEPTHLYSSPRDESERGACDTRACCERRPREPGTTRAILERCVLLLL